MTTQQIFDVFGLKCFAPVRVLKDDKEILDFIDFCIGAKEAFKTEFPKRETWAEKHFKGKCPYTDNHCDDWKCTTCVVNEWEKKEEADEIYGRSDS